VIEVQTCDYKSPCPINGSDVIERTRPSRRSSFDFLHLHSCLPGSCPVLTEVFTELFIMPTRCGAANFSNTHKDCVSLFSWPKDPQLFKLWERAVQMKRPDFKATKKSKLCSNHFKHGDFTLQTHLSSNIGIACRPRLLEKAVPTVFTCTPSKSKLDDSEADTATSTIRSAYTKREATRVCLPIVYTLSCPFFNIIKKYTLYVI